MLRQFCCYSSMHPTTNLLVLLLIVSTTAFLTGGAPQPQHPHGGCIPAERAALLSFKKGIVADGANLLASWHGRDCCRWRGVKCSNRTGHVLNLRLPNPNPDIHSKDGCADVNALFGEISPSLLSLQHLEHIDLSMNCLQGPTSRFPEFLGSMENLIYLNLSGIPFVGRVPPQLGNLSKLQHLDVGKDYYLDVGKDYYSESEMYSTDITWLTNLPWLQYVSISRVNLSGIADWPRMLNMIPSLRVVRLISCSLDTASQSLPYFNLTKLEKLDLSWNNFDNPVASSWYWKATGLKYLNLQGSSLFGQFPDALGNMTTLQVLDVSLNQGLMMAANLKNLCGLEILDLTGNGIDGDITLLMQRLPQCAWKNLQELHLGHNIFTGALPNLIGHFTSLTILDLSANSLTGSIPPGIGNLTCLTNLDLYGNNIAGPVPCCRSRQAFVAGDHLHSSEHTRTNTGTFVLLKTGSFSVCITLNINK